MSGWGGKPSAEAEGLAGNVKSDRAAAASRGRAAEDQALAWLLRQGLHLVERNFRCRGGEIDLIMQQGDELVFVEVRQRSGGSHGGAAASVTATKQARLILAARHFLQRYRREPRCRFDVIAVEGARLDRLDWLRSVIVL